MPTPSPQAISRIARDARSTAVLAWFGLACSVCCIAFSIFAACTPADRAIAGNVVADVAAVAGSAVPCAIISAASTSVSASACSAVSTDASDVAKLVANILASLPPAMRRADMGPPVLLHVRAKSGGDVIVTGLPQAMATYVAAEAEKRLADGGGS